MYSTKFALVGIWFLVTINSTWAVINGEVAKPGQFPYVVAIKTSIDGFERTCGGSLISQRLVLTAAKCLSTVSSVEVTLGTYDLSKTVDTKNVIKVEKHKFLIRSEYSAENNQHDIGLIILPDKVTLSATINIVKLPEMEDYFNFHLEESGTVIGFGKFNETEEEPNTLLRYANMTIIPLVTCELSYFFSLSTDQMCASGVSLKNICLGDIGSPLVVNGVQVGIASYGSIFGCNVGFPAVFTRLTSYIGWLKVASNF